MLSLGIKKTPALKPESYTNKNILGSGMRQEYVENCLAGWVLEHKRLAAWIKLTEEIINKPNHLSQFGKELYELMLGRSREEQAKCRRKIRWLGQLHDKAAGQHRFCQPCQKTSLDKEAIRERIDLVEFISGYTTLKRCGKNYKGLCPLHKEKTPSFYVNPDKGWYCHGCNKGGDVFTFVMETEGVSFLEAVKKVGSL